MPRTFCAPCGLVPPPEEVRLIVLPCKRCGSPKLVWEPEAHRKAVEMRWQQEQQNGNHPKLF